ncbi:MAG: hypothetical protein LBV09_05945 [Deferribacteraceae bacterium]|jgi:hypothetical protein|nr:hypothetical protein [Deferribacteraceae bacterium]
MKRDTLIKTLLTAAILLGGVLSFFILPNLFGLSAADDSGYYRSLQEALDSRLASASLFFMTTKLVSGIIAFSQDVNVDASVVLAGIDVSPLMVLQPVGSTINKISDLFLVAMGAIVLEKVVMIAGGWLSFKIFFPIAAAIGAVSLWGRHRVNTRKAAIGMLIIGIVSWGAVPLSIMTSTMLERYFMGDIMTLSADRVEKNASELEVIQSDLTDPSEWGVGAEKSSFLDKLKVPNVGLKINEVLTAISSKTENIVKDLVNAFIVLVITTLILPIGTIFVLWFVLRGLTSQ